MFLIPRESAGWLCKEEIDEYSNISILDIRY